MLELAVQCLAADPQPTAVDEHIDGTLRAPDGSSGCAISCPRRPGAAERLTLEIVETQAIEDVAEATRILAAHEGRSACAIAMDDFGAGYTSFRNLRSLGVDMVKIDGAFVQNLARLDRRPLLRAHARRARRVISASRPSRNGSRTRKPAGCSANGASTICKAITSAGRRPTSADARDGAVRGPSA